MKIKIILFMIFFYFLILFISNTFAEVTIRGKVQYWNLEQGINATKATKPENIEGGCYLDARRLLIEVEFDSPLTIDEQTYTDNSGNYEVTHRNPWVGNWQVDVEVRAEVKLTTISGDVTDNIVWAACYKGALKVWPYNGQTGDKSVGDDETLSFDVYIGGPKNNIDVWYEDEEGGGRNHLIAFFMCQVILDAFNWLEERLSDVTDFGLDTSLFYPTDETRYNAYLSAPGAAWIDVKKGLYYPEVIDKTEIRNNSKTVGQRWKSLRSTLTHEYGHKIMHDVYDYWPEPLEIWKRTSDHQFTSCLYAELGWVEGWAEFFAAAVLKWPTGNGEISDLSGLPLSYKKEYNIEQVYFPDTEQIFPVGKPAEIVPRIDFDGEGDFNWRDEVPNDKRDINEGENAAVLWDIYDLKGWEYLPKDQQDAKPAEWPVALKWYDSLVDLNLDHIWEMIAGRREYGPIDVRRQPDCLIDEGDVWEDSFWYFWKNKDDGYGNNTELMHGLKAIMYNRGITSTEYSENKPEVIIKQIDLENQKIEIEVTEEDTEDQPYLYYNLFYCTDLNQTPFFTEDQPLTGEWEDNSLFFSFNILPPEQWQGKKLIVLVHDSMLCDFTEYINLIPTLDFKLGWRELPSFIPLNTKNHLNYDFYPGRKANIRFWIENTGNKDFRKSKYQNIPLKLSLFIDRNDNQNFDPNEKVWEEEIDDLYGNSGESYNIELLLNQDKRIADQTDTSLIYPPGFHQCKLMVTVLPEEENQVNNSVIGLVEFIASPELAIPDFAVENGNFTIDQYKNIAVNFNLIEKCLDDEIVNKWNFYHPNDFFIPRWGPIPYELWIEDEYNYQHLLYSGEVIQLPYHQTRFITLDSMNLNYIPAGKYHLHLVVNPKMLLAESKEDNNHAYLNWFTLNDDTTSPWYTKGGGRGHTNWKNLNLKPPLITDWKIDTSGIPVDLVCNSNYFYVLTSSGSIEKYNTSGELQYTVSGFDGTPLLSSVMLLIYPDTANEKLLAFSGDYRLVLIDTQTGNKIWTSNHIFTETTYGSKPNLKEYSRTLDFDGRYLIAGWPLALYSFNSNLNLPSLLWGKEEFDAYHEGETFILGNNILAGQYLYNLNGEELNRLEWIGDEVILRLSNLYTDQYNYNYLSEQLMELKNFRNPGSLFSNNLLGGNKMRCLDNQGNELWVLPDEIEQEYYPPNSSTQSIKVYIQPNTINLWNDIQGYTYCINQGYQLLAVDLETGLPVWYREFVCPPELIPKIEEKIPPFLVSQLKLGSLFTQSPLTRGEGFSVNIQKIIPFQNSLLIGTIDGKVYRLSTSSLDHLEVQGYIPSIFYGPSRLKVKVQAFNEQGAEIPLEDKIAVTGDHINQNNPKYYYNQEEISLPIDLSDSKMYLVDYPNPPFIVTNNFNFIDLQTLSPRVSVPLVIENIQSRPIISQEDVPAGEEFVLSMDEEAQLKYKPKNSNNDVRLYYSDYGEEDLSQVVYEHSYHIIVGIRDALDIPKDYDFIDLQINLPEGVGTDNLTVKINKEPYNYWSLTNHTLIINCLNAFSEQNNNNLAIIILKPSE